MNKKFFQDRKGSILSMTLICSSGFALPFMFVPFVLDSYGIDVGHWPSYIVGIMAGFTVVAVTRLWDKASAWKKDEGRRRQ